MRRASVWLLAGPLHAVSPRPRIRSWHLRETASAGWESKHRDGNGFHQVEAILTPRNFLHIGASLWLGVAAGSRGRLGGTPESDVRRQTVPGALRCRRCPACERRNPVAAMAIVHRSAIQ